VYLLLIDLYASTYQVSSRLIFYYHFLKLISDCIIKPSKALNLINLFEKQLQIKTEANANTQKQESNENTSNDLNSMSIFRLKSFIQMKAFNECEKEFQNLSSSPSTGNRVGHQKSL
jgi:hypothetical protein